MLSFSADARVTIVLLDGHELTSGPPPENRRFWKPRARAISPLRIEIVFKELLGKIPGTIVFEGM
jgi:hypothetical protein